MVLPAAPKLSAEHFPGRRNGGIMRLANHDALAGGQSVRFHHQRHALRPHIAFIEIAAVNVAKLAVGMRCA